MIGLLLITHGQLAEDILKAAESIAGPVEMVECVTVDVIKDSEQLIGMIEKKIGSLDHGKGVLVLTDMLGGTPSNVAMSFLQENKVEIITGINLPMLIAVATPTTLPVPIAPAKEVINVSKWEISPADSVFLFPKVSLIPNHK